MSETVKAQFMTLTELPIIRKNTRNNFKNKRNYKIIEYNNYNNRYDIKDTDKNKRDNSTKNDLVNKSNKSMKKDFYLTNLKNRNSMNNRDTIQKTIYNIRTEGKQTNLKLNPNFINKLDAMTIEIKDSRSGKSKYHSKINFKSVNFKDCVRINNDSITISSSSENKKLNTSSKKRKLFLLKEPNINKERFSNIKKQLFISKNIKLDCGASLSTKSFINNNIPKNNTIINNDKKNNLSKPELKNITKHENINNINNYIMILKLHLSLENKLENIINKPNNYINSLYNDLIKLLNEFFEKLSEISFEINIFIEKEYNELIQKVIKTLICFYSIIFIILCLYDLNDSYNLVKLYFEEIRKPLSICIYNIFLKFISIEELKTCKYISLDFITELNEIMKKNEKYNIRNNNIEKIFAILTQTSDTCIVKLIIILDIEKIKIIEEITNTIKYMLMEINKKKLNLLEFIDILMNVFLFSLLEKNIKKTKFFFRLINYARNTVPYLPEIDPKYKYTIVLDMDETLGHCICNNIKKSNVPPYGYLKLEDNSIISYNDDSYVKIGMFLVRPYAIQFLEELNKINYEIVVFTAGTKEYCDKVLNILDINNYIKYRLYRSHLSLRNIDNDVKDLSLLGRDLNKIIIVDNLADNYKLQQNNGLPILPWISDISDMSLRYLIEILKKIKENNVRDVRKIIKKIKRKFKELGEVNYEKIDDESLS